MLLSHYHPTVSHYARNILNWVASPSEFVPISNNAHESTSKQISKKNQKKATPTSSSDQHQNVHINLSLHTLAHFLDRFVYRNPKKLADEQENEDGKPGSVMGKKDLMKTLKHAKENDLGRWHMSELGNKDEDSVPSDRVS